MLSNIPNYVPEASNYGLVGPGIRLFGRLGLANLVCQGCHNTTKAMKVRHRDFNTIMGILFDVEMAGFRHFHPSLVFLDGQITDLWLAFGNKELLARSAETMNGRYHAQPGLVTNNLRTLIPKLKHLNIPIQLVMAPFNQEGFAMKPNRDACEALIQENNSPFIADRISVDAKPCADTYHYLHEHGISSAVLDATEEDDLKLATSLFQHQG